MSQILALRPFVPAQDFAVSKRFYTAMGFTQTYGDDDIAMFKQESFSFILQNFYVAAAAENFMVQMLVRDADAWWRDVGVPALTKTFSIPAPRAPALQPWGMKVGFITDPSGVLWHIAEVIF